MSLRNAVKDALSLIRQGAWRALLFRVRVYVGQIDLKSDSRNEQENTHFYADSGGLSLEKVLGELAITPQDAILDFGCGKGGALITFSKYPFARITGVEISPELVRIAEKNLEKLNIKNVEVIAGDAAAFTELDDYTYVYLFNPFPCHVVRSVIDNIKRSCERKNRTVTILYLNPECHDAVIADSPFMKQGEFDHPKLRYYLYSNAPR
jgi:SAM-dependent methyltransferase